MNHSLVPNFFGMFSDEIEEECDIPEIHKFRLEEFMDKLHGDSEYGELTTKEIELHDRLNLYIVTCLREMGNDITTTFK